LRKIRGFIEYLFKKVPVLGRKNVEAINMNRKLSINAKVFQGLLGS